MQNQDTSKNPPEKSGRIRFAPESVNKSAETARKWKLLVVDDEREIHGVTHLALDGFRCHGRGLEMLDAYSGAEACRIAKETPDIAVILMDVVMESDHAGLDAIRHIRDELGNRFVRIILRTGQPGQAPEHRVITDFDINDYKSKTELTRQKLFTTVYTSISSYRDLIALDANRRGLEQVIESSAQIFSLRSLDQFSDGVLNQLTALLYLDQDALVVHASGLAAACEGGACEVISAIGKFIEYRGKSVENCGDPDVLSGINQAHELRKSVNAENYYVGYHSEPGGHEHFLYVTADAPISDLAKKMVDLFVRNVAIAHTNLRLMTAANANPD